MWVNRFQWILWFKIKVPCLSWKHHVLLCSEFQEGQKEGLLDMSSSIQKHQPLIQFNDGNPSHRKFRRTAVNKPIWLKYFVINSNRQKFKGFQKQTYNYPPFILGQLYVILSMWNKNTSVTFKKRTFNYTNKMNKQKNEDVRHYVSSILFL